MNETGLQRRLAEAPLSRLKPHSWEPTPRDVSVPQPLLREAVPCEAVEWSGKRWLDVAGALVLAAVFSPVFVGVAAWLWLKGEPVLFRHQRIGRAGRLFTCYKFATMVKDADRSLADLLERRPDLRTEWARDQKLRDDPRVTRLGRLLRKTSLDELPQLWNVLKGDMSLVGPRPIVQEEVFKYRGGFKHYLATRPGITGLWQVSGRSDTRYRRRVAIDRVYVTRSSFALDLWILLRTVRVVVARRGAY